MRTAICAAAVFFLFTAAPAWSAEGALNESVATGNAAQASFLDRFVVQGGPIVWFILLPMSVLTIALAVDMVIGTRRKRLLPPDIASDISRFAAHFAPARLGTKLAGRHDLVSKSLLSAYSDCKSAPDDKHLRQLAAQSLNRQGRQLLRKTELFNIVANVAPMVGLFGTVYGMIMAFNILGIAAGQPRPDRLADAISVALVTTFWGLLIAIPALVIYNFFRIRIEGLVTEAGAVLDAVFSQLGGIWSLKNPPVQKLAATEEPGQKADAETAEIYPLG